MTNYHLFGRTFRLDAYPFFNYRSYDLYYVKIPAELAADTLVYILDPMLATGGSAIAAVDILKQRGVTDIHFCCLIASPEGIQALSKAHPDIQIHTTSVDEKLNELGYIIPGLGDAGDRAFSTSHKIV